MSSSNENHNKTIFTSNREIGNEVIGNVGNRSADFKVFYEHLMSYLMDTFDSNLTVSWKVHTAHCL